MPATSSATKSEFVQTPLSVLEADMPPAHKVGFQFLLYRCWRDHCDFVRGSYRALAKLLHVAKTSFIDRILPAWITAGWITVEEVGKELIITLCRVSFAVPPRDTFPPATTETNGPNRDTSVPLLTTTVPPRDKDVPPRDKSVPLVSSNLPVISNSTDIITNLLTEVSSNVSSLTVPPRDTEEIVPLLTPELVLQLSSQVLPVPQRPTSGTALERWMKAWYTAAQDLIADFAPVTGPLAWREMDEVIRFTASPESGWMKKIGRLPTLENIRNTRHIQFEQMARLGGWQPDERTPYPGVPLWDDQQVSQEDTQLLAQQELDALVTAILAPNLTEQGQMACPGTVPTWDDQQEEVAFQEIVPAMREAQPFAPGKLKPYADSLQEANPELILSCHILPDGSGRRILLVKVGPGNFAGLDPEIWENPTADEEALIIWPAINYGNACLAAQQEAVTI